MTFSREPIDSTLVVSRCGCFFFLCLRGFACAMDDDVINELFSRIRIVLLLNCGEVLFYIR